MIEKYDLRLNVTGTRILETDLQKTHGIMKNKKLKCCKILFFFSVLKSLFSWFETYSAHALLARIGWFGHRRVKDYNM